MVKPGFRQSIVSFVFRAFLVILLIIGGFAVVYLRSSFIKLEYSVASLEKEKTSCLKERKMLLAQKSGFLGFEKLGTSLNKDQKFIIPDRLRVIHVQKAERYLPHKASLESRALAEP